MALRAYQGRVVGVADLALRTECLVLPVRAAMTRPRGCGVTPRIPRRKADGAWRQVGSDCPLVWPWPRSIP